MAIEQGLLFAYSLPFLIVFITAFLENYTAQCNGTIWYWIGYGLIFYIVFVAFVVISFFTRFSIIKSGIGENEGCWSFIPAILKWILFGLALGGLPLLVGVTISVATIQQCPDFEIQAYIFLIVNYVLVIVVLIKVVLDCFSITDSTAHKSSSDAEERRPLTPKT